MKNLEKKNLEKRISRSGYRIETPVRIGFLECLLYAWLFYGSSIQLASQRNEFELQQSFNEQQQCNEYLDWRASRFSKHPKGCASSQNKTICRKDQSIT